jgi:hypothetical protein
MLPKVLALLASDHMSFSRPVAHLLSLPFLFFVLQRRLPRVSISDSSPFVFLNISSTRCVFFFLLFFAGERRGAGFVVSYLGECLIARVRWHFLGVPREPRVGGVDVAVKVECPWPLEVSIRGNPKINYPFALSLA